MDVIRYYFTIKHLKPIQIIGRLRHRLFSPQPDLAAAPPLRGVSGVWVVPAKRRASMLGAGRCRFLNETHRYISPCGMEYAGAGKALAL